MTATRETLREAVARAIRDLTFSALTMDETRDVADAALAAIEAAGWRIVPADATEEQWGGLARAILFWWGGMDRPTGILLYQHLRLTGETIPDWLIAEIPEIDHVPPKGTVAACIYRAMLEAAPSIAEKE